MVVTRAAEQAGLLVERLEMLGAEVVDVPVIGVADPSDGGTALRRGLAQPGRVDWIVVTSPNGARRMLGVLAEGGLGTARVAAVGPGTADALRSGGLEPALVPRRALAEGLLEDFPPCPPGGGRVLLVQAEAARPVLADGLRAAGWDVEQLVAYRTLPVVPPAGLLARAARADAVTFTSGSTVRAFVHSAGAEGVPPVVVCIGPVTAEVAGHVGLRVTAVAEPHTLDGLVSAVVEALAR